MKDAGEGARGRAALELDRRDRPGRGLAPWTRRVAQAAAEAMLCDEDERGELVPPGAGVCERAVAALDLSLGQASPETRRGFALLAVCLEVLPLFVIGAFSRMSRLPLARRLAYLEALESSRSGLLAMLLLAFKVPLCIPAFEEGAELALTGLDRESTAARRRLPALRPAAGAPPSAPVEARDGAPAPPAAAPRAPGAEGAA
ncbi:hypothetical protein [Sorangium sp. So ce1335]|uniref:hypothetical protein n=1 Tax=Sorangium sp. So ce1335 TaxID=3133335 RepID=UPI003F630CC7